MAKKLSPDYINWVLTLNATQAQEEYHKLEKANKSLKAETTASRKAMAELEAQGKKGSEEWINLRKSISQNNRAMAENRRKMDEVAKRFDLTTMTVSQLRKRLKDLQREFSNTSKATDPKRYKELRDQINKTQAALDKANASARGLQGGFFSLTKMKQTLIGFFNGVGLTIFALITGAFKNAFNIIVEFEKANSRLASVLGTNRDGIKELTAAARQLGATTSYTAAEVTGLQIELAKLGFGQEQILKMEGAVLKFAKAVDTDLARASAFAGAALRIFNKDASETEDVLATFAVATTKTALDFSKLEASLSTVGPVANAFGLPIEDTTALLGQLANAGFDASSAATATRNIILNLCDANGDLAKALGSPVRNAEDLAKGLKKLNDEGIDLAKALDLTDKRSVAAFSTFLNSADTLTELKDSITDVNKQFNDMSETMSDNVAGAMAGLQSAAQELVLKISEGTNGPIKDLIKALTSLVQWVGEAYQWLTKFGGLIKGVAAGFAAYKLAVFLAHTATKLYFATLRTGSAIMAACRAAILLLSTGFKAMIGNIKAATTSFNALKVAMASTPWTAVIGAIAAVCAAVFTLSERTEKAVSAQDALKAAQESAARQYGEQKAKLMGLIAVAKNEKVSLDRRLSAVKELNNTIPEYNAQIDKTTEKYTASAKALEDYLVLLEKELRYKANLSEMERLVSEAEKARREHDDVVIQQTARKENAAKEADVYARNRSSNIIGALVMSQGAALPDSSAAKYQELGIIKDAEARIAASQKRLDAADDAVKALEEYINKGLTSGTLIASKIDEITGTFDNAAGAVESFAGTTQTQADTVADALDGLAAEHGRRMEAIQAFYDRQEYLTQRAVVGQQVTQEAADLYLMNVKKQMHTEQLEELAGYFDKVSEADSADADRQEQLLDTLSGKIHEKQSQILTDTGNYAETLRELMTDTTSMQGITKAFDLQRKSIESTYAAAIQIAQQNGEDTVALETEKQRRIAALNYQYQEQMWQLQEGVGLSWAQEYDRELAALENMHRQGLIKEKDYQRKKLQLGVTNAKKYFDYYAGLSGSMFTAIQDAEIAKSDAKFDVLIQQAKNNGEDTAALEEEKENKKLEIQKKYADVNFAIKISQIVADTAVAIMKAWADLGPIGGPIAAAMIAATGIAQGIQAKAERDKIKNMQPGNTSGVSSEKPATAQRVLTGYADGGYTGDGDRYEIAGVVHRGEYVVPKPIMENPRVVDAVGTIEAIRRNKLLGQGIPAGTPSAGYAEGGYTSAAPAPDYSELTATIKELKEALKNIRAHVVLRDIERAQDSMSRARAPFTRKR